ncbi:MAG: HD domain-containing protein [Candidatus Methanomethylicaceae archaeon]|nr:HD domain-containing protein [Candidatus Verstraetearchaeota archaeon]
MNKAWGMIKDPVHGFVHIYKIEKDVIDTLPLQRLRRIKQLVFVDLVYPGANHTRFEHSIGVMHLAGMVCKALPIDINNEEIQMIRLSALFHDLGHGPFSHTFESILIKKLNKTHEDLTPWIIKGTELKDILESYGFSVEDIAELSIGKWKKGRKFFNQIISSAIDVDKMDFLVRDTHHTGAEYGKVDIHRLIYTMNVIDDNLLIDSSAIPTLEAFLIARLESFKAIYFHKTARAAQILLVKALEAADEELGICSFKSPEEYVKMDDYSIWYLLKQCNKSSKIMEAIEKRQLLKCSYERELKVEDKTLASLINLESIRKRLEEEIANIAGISNEEVFIDTPTLPSIPYKHALDFDPMEIPILDIEENKKRVLKATEISKTIEVLRGFLNIVRVYTYPQYREKVREAAEKVLGGIPNSARVSY